MKLKTLVSIAVPTLLLSMAANSQEEFQTYPNQKTDIPEDARYEFIQSPIAAKATFKFDRFTGDTYQIVRREDSTLTWQTIHREIHPKDNGQIKNKVNYQLFLSGLSMRFTYLMNIRSGAVWQLVKTPADDYLWELIE